MIVIDHSAQEQGYKVNMPLRMVNGMNFRSALSPIMATTIGLLNNEPLLMVLVDRLPMIR
jgi:hypothetical protein